MPYGPWDEYFVHQLPRTLDHVHDSHSDWSDRCYFYVNAPGGEWFVVNGYGNNPNSQRGSGYAKIVFADGRHWDLDAGRRVVDDRGDLHAGPMRWTCVEPLKRWKVELGPNDSGFEYELLYESRAPMWELLPIVIRKRGRTIVDMTHMKQSGSYTGWVQVDGERFPVDGCLGGRDRTFGVRMSVEVDFWLWMAGNFDDRSVEAYVFEARDGTSLYVDGGFTMVDGSLSKRFVKCEHDIRFDGDRRRPTGGEVVFTDEDGKVHRITLNADQQNVGVYYGFAPAFSEQSGNVSWYRWNAEDPDRLGEIERGALSMDQLVRYEVDGMVGRGVLELFVMGDGYDRYPNWAPVRR